MYTCIILYYKRLISNRAGEKGQLLMMSECLHCTLKEEGKHYAFIVEMLYWYTNVVFARL